MRLTVFNGSPRGEKSTTRILLQHFLDGFMATEGNSHEVLDLIRLKEGDRFVESFREAEHVLLAFPLYHDSMPAMVKTFIESLEPLQGRTENPSIGFLVHSGFPEANHSRYVERYLEKLARRLGCKYLGTIIKGGANRIDEQPGFMSNGVFKSFRELGRSFGETGQFDERIVAKLASPERLPAPMRWMFRVVLKTRFAYLGWNKHLKANNAYEKRFARPYASGDD
ncbi:MAG: NAD(P)H-dependent oxidoreductase [Dehalococcoidia bacterium]